jgi:hypothetical protein
LVKRGFFFCMIDEKELFKQVSNTINNESITISVIVKNSGWFIRLMIYLRIIPKVKIFTIKQLVLGNLIRISKLLVGIDRKLYDFSTNKDFLESNYTAMSNYGRSLCEIVAIALYNKSDPPGRKLIKFIESNFTAQEILNVMYIIVKQMDVTSFMTTIISVKGIVIHQEKSVSANPVEEVSL